MQQYQSRIGRAMEEAGQRFGKRWQHARTLHGDHAERADWTAIGKYIVDLYRAYFNKPQPAIEC